MYSLLRVIGLFLCSIILLYMMAAPLSSFAATSQGDVVSPGSGLTLGSSWYTREFFDGRPFHWVDNDAAIIIHRPHADLKKISIEVQGGPGLQNAQKFLFHLRDDANRDIASVTVTGEASVRFDIPVHAGHDKTVRLHVDGGGKRVPKDPRVLNFRIFSIADASSDKRLGAGHPDITENGVTLGANWDALEEFSGETFRWVANDAEFSINANGNEQRRLMISAASGPAIKSPSNWLLALLDENGKLVQANQMKARGISFFELSLKPGRNSFRFHVLSTGSRAPNDPRVLSFRVFSLSLK